MKQEKQLNILRARTVLAFFDEWFPFYRGSMHYETFKGHLYYTADCGTAALCDARSP
jgi:hypothetical protein